MDEKKKGTISRRDFLRGSMIGAAAAISVAAVPSVSEAYPKAPHDPRKWSWEAPAKPISKSDIKKTVNTDVLVIGAGLSGIVAALSAAECGASVQVVDKNATWAARGGHITAFGSKVQKKMGIENDHRQIIRDWIAWAQGRVEESLLWEFGRKSGACMDWTVDIAAKHGLEVAMWDGYYKGPDYTEYPVTHFFYKKGGNAAYVNGVATEAGNIVLVPALESEAKSKGVVFNYKTPAVRILKDASGKASGVIAGRAGKYTQYNAKSVIIATGDYASNLEMRECFAPFTLLADAQIYFPNKCNTGDGLVMAMQAGGAMQRHDPHAAVIHLEAGAGSYGFLHVNALGERFKNEDVNTQSKSCTKELEPGGIAWTVYDKYGIDQVKQQLDAGLAGGLFYGQTFQKWGSGFDVEMEKSIQQQHIKDGKILVADSIEELARKMNVPADKFKATIARYNELYKMQDDPDYGKRKELLTPIGTPPFYAGKLISTILTMCGGLRTDTSLQVLTEQGEPIKNLYVVGSAQGEFFANDYPTICPGIGHGRCITFGRMAGILAAGEDPDVLIPSIKI